MSTGTHILVVDQDAEVRAEIRRVLQGADYQTASMTTVKAATAKIKTSDEVGLILLDMSTAGESVAEACARLTEGSSRGVIVLVQPGQRAWSLARTVDSVLAVVPKPINGKALLATVSDALRSRGGGRPPKGSGAQEKKSAEPQSGAATTPSAGGTQGGDAAVREKLIEAVRAWDGAQSDELLKSLSVLLGRSGGSPAPPLEPGRMFASSDVMGLDQILQSLAGVSATGTLAIESPDCSMEMHVRKGRLVLVEPKRVNLTKFGESGVFGYDVAIPADKLRGGESGSVFSVFGEVDRAVLRKNVIHIGIDTLRRSISHAEGYGCDFLAKNGEWSPAADVGVDLDMDIRSFLLQAHSMIDEYRDACESANLLGSRFRRIDSLNPSLLAGLTATQVTVIESLHEECGFWELVNSCSMNPMALSFDLFPMVSMRLVEQREIPAEDSGGETSAEDGKKSGRAVEHATLDDALEALRQSFGPED